VDELVGSAGLGSEDEEAVPVPEVVTTTTVCVVMVVVTEVGDAESSFAGVM
jgi:hypothetical protein